MEQKQVISTEHVTVKCFKCGERFTEEDVYVVVDPIYDPDTNDFIQYDVQFLDYLNSRVYIEDRLCLPKHCSVFGKCEDGRVFAFAYLVPNKAGGAFLSKPGPDGFHFAVRKPRS